MKLEQCLKKLSSKDQKRLKENYKLENNSTLEDLASEIISSLPEEIFILTDEEINTLAIACSGVYQSNKWQRVNKEADFYLVKGFVETIFERLGINESRYRLERVESDNQSFHPGRSAYIKVQNEIVGVVGQIHPLMEKKYDVKDVYVVELNLSALLNIKTGKVKYQPIPQ